MPERRRHHQLSSSSIDLVGLDGRTALVYKVYICTYCEILQYRLATWIYQQLPTTAPCRCDAMRTEERFNNQRRRTVETFG